MAIARLYGDALFRSNRSVGADAKRFAADLAEAESIDGLIHLREDVVVYVLAHRAAQRDHVVEIWLVPGKVDLVPRTGAARRWLRYKIVSTEAHVDPTRTPPFSRGWGGTTSPSGSHRTSRSRTIAASFDGPSKMLWIDCDHSYQAVQENFSNWFPRRVQTQMALDAAGPSNKPVDAGAGQSANSMARR